MTGERRGPALCHWRARLAVRGSEWARTVQGERRGTAAGRRRQLLCAVSLSPGGGQSGPGPGGRPGRLSRGLEEDQSAVLQPGSLVAGVGARRPGLARRAGSRSLPGSSGWRPQLHRWEGGRLRPSFFYYYYYFPRQPTLAVRPARGQGLLSDSGFPEQTWEFV